MNELQADLQNRWKPSDTQTALAEDFLAANALAEDVWSVHVLVGKRYGFWTADVQVIHLEGRLFTRNDAYAEADAVAKLAEVTTGKPCMGGVTRHSRIDDDLAAALNVKSAFAVWEA